MNADLIVDPALFAEDVNALKAMLQEHSGAGPGNDARLNRQLLVVAVSARQIMDFLKMEDSRDSSGKGVCGNHYVDALGESRPFSFYSTCNAIIHAARRPRYAFDSRDDAALITIHGTKRVWTGESKQAACRECGRQQSAKKKVNAATTAEIQGTAFLECCTMISSIMAQNHDPRLGGEVAEGGSRDYAASKAISLEDSAMADKNTAETDGKVKDGDAKDFYVYAFDVENTIVEAGVTRDLNERQYELRLEWPHDYCFIEPMHYGSVTLAEAKRKLNLLRENGWPVKMETLNQL